MSETDAPAAGPRPWARIDARSSTAAPSIGASTRLCGLSLLGRQIRTAARLGWAGAEILVATNAERADVETSLQREPPPPGFPVEIGDAEGPTTELRVPLALRSVYTRDALAAAAEAATTPTPMIEIASPADLAIAERKLFESIRKPVSHDGIVGYYVMRPISNRISRALIDTKVTPNQVTVLAGLLGVVGGLLAATGGHLANACAGLLVWAGAVIDCIDGDLARLRLQGSRLGQWLDTLADDVTTLALVIGLGVGLTRDGAGDAWTVIGVAAAIVWAVTEAKVYVDLDRMGMPIDTAQYPWFFGDPSKAPAADAGFVSRAFNVVGYIFKRDAFMTLIAIALIFDWRRTATAALALGNFVLFALLGIHLYLKRRAPAPIA